MDLLKRFCENDAVCGGDVAVAATPLGIKAIKRETDVYKPLKKKKLKLRETFSRLMEMSGDSRFDDTAIIDKLRSLEKRDSIEATNCAKFALEDNNGNVVKVSVQGDQAQEFENALRRFLTDEESTTSQAEIAEVLFKLRREFDIIDVEWPDVEEDEETDQQVDGGEEVDDIGLGAGDEELADLDGAELGDVAVDDGAASVLTQVINMMKADADARKAEAVARQREAEARNIAATARTATAKVKREEELMDMDTYYKEQRAADREAKQLAKLAKWKHEVGDEQAIDDYDSDFGMPDEEESAPIVDKNFEDEERHGRNSAGSVASFKQFLQKGRLHPAQVADLIIKRVR